MSEFKWREKDIEQIREHGLAVEAVERQIRIFEKGAPYADLDRPCTVGDGIERIGRDEAEAYADFYEKTGPSRRPVKFVPASGAATRMFKALLKIAGEHERILRDDIAEKAAAQGGDYNDVLAFIDNIAHFAFYEALAKKLEAGGHDIEALREKGDYSKILAGVLESWGLDYANRPKGQILFHSYPEGSRTAFEEHLVEAALYSKDDKAKCHLHLTVSPEHEDRFKRILSEKGPDFEKAYGVVFDTGFSRQHPSTDTIAVDMENRPFRDADGRLVFRPGGHGALIGNVNNLGADVIFIKNIDNVVPDDRKPDTVFWKKVLGGLMLTIEKEIAEHRRNIRQGGASGEAAAAALEFVEGRLGITVPDRVRDASAEEKGKFLLDRMDRPFRVCGMVPSSGEAGGGPFWVRSPDGGLSMQIVESAQIDPDSSGQQRILKDLTHFNPVDIVCSVRDENGSPYDLTRFVDDSAVFISQKSKDGRDLKALEHPGLWNGSMAWWNTIFVEVPLSTFNPVKTVNDLLRDAHRAGY